MSGIKTDIAINKELIWKLLRAASERGTNLNQLINTILTNYIHENEKRENNRTQSANPDKNEAGSANHSPSEG